MAARLLLAALAEGRSLLRGPLLRRSSKSQSLPVLRQREHGLPPRHLRLLLLRGKGAMGGAEFEIGVSGSRHGMKHKTSEQRERHMSEGRYLSGGRCTEDPAVVSPRF